MSPVAQLFALVLRPPVLHHTTPVRGSAERYLVPVGNRFGSEAWDFSLASGSETLFFFRGWAFEAFAKVWFATRAFTFVCFIFRLAQGWTRESIFRRHWFGSRNYLTSVAKSHENSNHAAGVHHVGRRCRAHANPFRVHTATDTVA